MYKIIFLLIFLLSSCAPGDVVVEPIDEEVTEEYEMATDLTINLTTDANACCVAESWLTTPPIQNYIAGGAFSAGHFKLLANGVYEFSIRFPGVTIPQSSTINTATMSLYQTNDAGMGGGQLLIKAFDEDDSGMAGSFAAFVAKAETTASVAWTPGSVAVDTPRTTPDISSVIQEIVNRGSWSSGNAIQIYVKDDTYDLNTGSNPGCADTKVTVWAPDSSYNISLSINYTPATQDSGVRIYTSGGVKKVAAADSLGTESLRVYTGDGVKGIKLVATDAATAIDGLRVYDGADVKCLEEYT